MNMRKKIGVDLDGTLCVGRTLYSSEDALKAEPIQAMINRVNKLYITDFVIIYTARQNHFISATLDWLDAHNVHYHAISNKKIPLDNLIDDITEPK